MSAGNFNANLRVGGQDRDQILALVFRQKLFGATLKCRCFRDRLEMRVTHWGSLRKGLLGGATQEDLSNTPIRR